jgi:hypothetical protein
VHTHNELKQKEKGIFLLFFQFVDIVFFALLGFGGFYARFAGLIATFL